MRPVDEVEYLRVECQKLAALLMSEFVFVHERLVADVDAALAPYRGRQAGPSVSTVNGSES